MTLPIRLLVVAAIFVATHSAFAQWQMIGPDGVPGEILKVGSSLYGLTKYGFYESDDDGQSWKRQERGLTKRYQHNLLEVWYDGFDLVLPAASFNKNHYDRGFFILDRENEVWEYRDSTYDKLYTDYTTRISVDSFISIIPNPFLSNTEGFDTIAAIYLTTDKGTTWIKRTPPGNQVVTYFQFLDQRIFVTTHDEATPHLVTFLQSEDYGITWQAIDFPGSNEGYFQLFGPFAGYLIGKFNSNPYFHRSTDHGKTWGELTDGITEGGPSSWMRIDTFDLLQYYSTPMLVAHDEGRQWKPFTTAGGDYIHRIVRSMAGNGYLAMVSESMYGPNKLCQLDNTLRVVDTAANRGFITTSNWLLYASDSLLVAAGNTLFHPQLGMTDSVLISTDRGDSWTTQKIATPGLGIHFNPWKKGDTYNYSIGIADTSRFTIIRSSDHGLHWEDAGPAESLSGFPTIMAVANETLLIQYADGEVHYQMSTDAGSNWRSIASNSPNSVLGECFLNGYLYEFYILDRYEISRTKNGVIWEHVRVPREESVSMEYGGMFSVGGILYIPAGAYTSGGTYSYFLYRSSDEGENWTSQQADLTSYYIHLVHDGTTLYLLTMEQSFIGPIEGHPRIFSSSDNGVTWTQVSSPIPEATFLFVTESDLFASSWEGGIYRQTKAAATVATRAVHTPQSISLFPNPATDRISISHGVRQSGIYSYSITTLTGSVVLTTSTYNGETENAVFTLSTADLPSGIYTLSVSSPQGIERKLFTVRR